MSKGNIFTFTSLLPDASARYFSFLSQCMAGTSQASITPNAEPTAFAICFGVFGLHLLHDKTSIESEANNLATNLSAAVRKERSRHGSIPTGKPYRQLLTFTLSVLAILGALADDPLEDLVTEQLPVDLEKELRSLGCLEGKPQSGNQAMFLAVFLLHARDVLGLNVQSDIDRWVDLHMASMNRHGFWGPDRGMTHLQFQNGYHQHEILEYLGIPNPRAEQTVAAVRSLADPLGHFAPYPGGGGCYDYDAVFMLTPEGHIPDDDTRELLLRTAATILSEQRPDGGYADSLYVRPRLANLSRFAGQVWRATGNLPLFIERLRNSLALQRPQYDRIHTHWSHYSRRWDESDLWDSWFRMLALARIEIALDPSAIDRWGFIDYPGIGFHPALRNKHAETA